MTPTQEAKFNALVQKGTDSECWPWLGALSRGVAYFRSDSRSYAASRVAWTLWRGEVPPGKLVVHVAACGLSSCVNPAHLAIGTHKDRHRPARRETKCRRCFRPLMRSTHVKRPVCAKCSVRERMKRQHAFMSRLRTQARRYRIMLHVLGWEDSEFDDMLEAMKASPMAFREKPEGRLARLDITLEDRSERRRLLAAYAEGLDMEMLIERFGKTADVINKTAERAGVSRPAGHIGHVRRTQAGGAA